LDVCVHRVCEQVNVATSPQEIPLGIEHDVPCEHNLRAESPWEADDEQVEQPPEDQKEIPERV